MIQSHARQEVQPVLRGRRGSRGYRGLLLDGKVSILVAGMALLMGAALLLAQYLFLEGWLESAVGGPVDPETGTRTLEWTAESPGAVARKAALQLGGTVLLISAICLLGMHWIVRRATRPLRELIRAAEEVAAGNLDPVIEGARRVNCWEITSCRETQCKAYLNLDQPCWYIDGTPCEGYEPRFPEKLQGCHSCEVYRHHRGDEIRQLVDAFKHMLGRMHGSQEELLKSSDLQTRLIRNSYNGVMATDDTGQITIFNIAAEKILGVDRSEVIGKRHWSCFLDRSLERDLDRPLSYERIRRVRGFRYRSAVMHTIENEPVAVLLSGISLFDRGMHVGRVFFFQDMREIQGLREELIRSERLAATGQAAAGISHSIKNILDGFRGGAYVYNVGKKKGDPEKMDQGWGMVERNMEIISHLVMDLLNFAKEREPELEAVEARRLIEETIASLGLVDHETIEMVVEIETDESVVVLDPAAFQQCLGNLIRNAAEAIPIDRSGKVTVSFRREEDRALFVVRDDGIGMSAETMKKIRGGMYSTKGSKGTGLGLLVIQKVVEEHCGSLAMESEVGEGSSFRIEIPQGPSRDQA